MSQDRADLSAVAKTMSQHMAKPREGVVPILKRTVRYLKKFPKSSLVIPRDVEREDATPVLEVWTDSAWAGEASTRRSTSGGYIRYRGVVLLHWSKLQSNIALSSGEAELNATVKGLSEVIGLYNLIEETMKVKPQISLFPDASACKGMLLRHGAGRIKHLSVKQLWAQEVVSHYRVGVSRVSRYDNASDVLTHSVSGATLERQLSRIDLRRYQ